MIKSIIILAVVLLSYTNILAQDYWQQNVDYNIKVELDDSLSILNGDIKITYTNNSPDGLDFIYFHLWANAYSNESTALCEQLLLQGNKNLYNATDEDRGNISEIDFASQGTKLKWEFDSKHVDIAKVFLNKSLKTGESIIITTPFKVKIPSSDFSRLGHAEQSFQITQWYPKPAVYDAKGWHQMPYLNQGEFYSEFGKYDVSITIPKNYIVGATGDMVNCDSEERWLDSISEATKLIDEFDIEIEVPLSSKELKTLVFHQENIHDFAWFADKNYHVLRDYITLDNGHKILIQSMFTNDEAELWKESLKYLKQSTEFYSEFVGNYPYNHVTAVQGALSAGAGMEYPNITIIGLSSNKYVLEETIMHEVGHNWFYGMLGFNEREHPWMDEGLNSFVQNEYMKKYHPGLTLDELYFGRKLNIMRLSEFGEHYFGYLSNRFTASYNLDQASGLHSIDYTSSNYGISVYQRTSLIIDYLKQYLGEDEFGEIFKSFFDKWQYKHPQPEDFLSHFENESGKDLSWVLNDLIDTKKRIDYKIKSINTNGDSMQIKLKNIGNISAPIHIKATDDGGVLINEKWVDGFESTKSIAFPNGDYHKISINNDYSLLDFTPENNSYKPNSTFHKANKLKLKFITTTPKKNEQYLYYTPILGWNNYDKFMAGVLLFNHSLLEKKWEYELMPLYSFNQKALSGSFGLHRNFYTLGFIRRLSIGVVGKRYHYNLSMDDSKKLSYTKLSPELNFYFKNPEGNTNISHMAKVRLVNIQKEVETYYVAAIFPASKPIESIHKSNIVTLDYQYVNKRALNPYGLYFNFQTGFNITKASISLEYALSYNDKKNNALEMRLFAGNIFLFESDQWVDYSYKMSSFDGSDDYLYDYTYFDRSGYNSGQVTPSDGSFYLPSSLGRSWGFISALNIRAGIPFTKFIKIYGNFGYTLSKDYSVFYDKQLLAEGGVLLTFFNRTFEVYFPLLWTSQFQDVMDINANYKYSDNIRFTLRMDLMNPFKLKKEFNL